MVTLTEGERARIEVLETIEDIGEGVYDLEWFASTYGSDIKIQIVSYDYDGFYMSVVRLRPETDREYEDRMKLIRKRKRDAAAAKARRTKAKTQEANAELAEYERLKKKFG